MNFIRYDFGNVERGRIVEVILDAQANVRLLDSSNFNAYKNGRQHKYYGGRATKSPIRLEIPYSAHWYLVIDLRGYSGRVKHSARILGGMLPAMKENVPLIDESKLFVAPVEEGKEFDVFISHASEDKEMVVRPLAQALKASGIRVWYDEFELRIGDSLRRKIDQGLARSRFGIVVISRPFIQKGWTNYELDGLITKANSGQQALLPIWHEITKQEVIDYSPSLADKVARNTSQFTIDEIASEIAQMILHKEVDL